METDRFRRRSTAGPGTAHALRLPHWAGALFTAAFAAGCSSDEDKSKPTATTSNEVIAPVGAGFNLNASDIRFILQQIKIAENHAAGGTLLGTGPNQVSSPLLPFGLRTVDGSFNNLLTGQQFFGASDRVFPRLLTPLRRPAEAGTSYAQKKGTVVDSRPRIISNLIVDQTANNPSAVEVAGLGAVPEPSGAFFIPNVAPDVGLSAPYNTLFTFFGQFFDHGLDLVNKGRSGTVFVPLQPDDPLFVPGSPLNFMVLTRATNLPGPDGVVGDDPATPQDESLDDIQEGTNQTTPFVDQNQTYTSHPSHQVFLRQYRLDAAGKPVSTGKMIDGAIAGNIGNWGEVKHQALTMLGIRLEDVDALNVPLLATDPYGRFLRGPNGFPLVAFPNSVFVEGNPLAPTSVAGSLKTGHAFLDDIAHHAVPFGDHDNNPQTPPQALTPDADPGTADDGNPATYDDELLAAHFCTGDGRGNENIALTTVHTIFHAEHNRLAANIDGLIQTLLTPSEIADWNAVNPASGYDYGERIFQAARFVTEMQYQHLVFEEFARKVQPEINPFTGFDSTINPAIVAEFAHQVYRFGHTLLTETVGRKNLDGTTFDIPLLNAFLNPLEFNRNAFGATVDAQQAAGAIINGLAANVGNELDEFVTEAVRNRLLGLPLDLATINISRGRSEGIPGLNAARRAFFNATANSALTPYESWSHFGLGLRNPSSLVNYVAAYGTHPSIAGTNMFERRAAAQLLVAADPTNPATPADAGDFMQSTGAWRNVGGITTTGVDDIDFWVGGIAEKQAPFGGLLGSTFNFVFETQLERLQDGDRFYYLSRTAGLNLLVQLEGNSFAELAMRNTDAINLPADAFSRPDLTFHVANLGTTGPIVDDPTTPDNEAAMPDLLRMPDGTIRYAGELHVIFIGSDDPLVGDRIEAGEGDDTLRGNAGNDIMEGGAGNDNFIGGLGDDIITDSFGIDTLKGGDGNDALSSGPTTGDLNQGGRGNDFIVSGSDPTETFGGPDNDFIFAGDSEDIVFGDDGDDWLEGGGQADLLQGDNGAPFQDDPNQPGNDVINGNGGNDDYDSEGGDDIMLAGEGTERFEGMLGFDWVTYKGTLEPADADMFFTGLLPPDLDNIRDRFDLNESLSGWNFNDILRGDDRDELAMVGHELTAEGIARIEGLSSLLRGATSFTGGNIIIGGAGSDTLEGRGGNDILHGDAWLNAQLEAPNPATLDPSDTQLVDSMEPLRADVFAGRINPGSLRIVRTIVTAGSPTDVDTAVFRGNLNEYVISLNADGSLTVDHQGGIDGVDLLWKIELLQFADVTIPAPTTGDATGTVTISDTTPTEGQALSVTASLSDPNGVNQATVVLEWQAETTPGLWTPVGTGTTFTPDDPQVGRRLRVSATFLDNLGLPGRVDSEPTALVQAINDPATGAPTLSNTNPVVGATIVALTASIQDNDGLGAFSYQWRANGAPIAGATTSSFPVTAAQLGQQLSVTVSYTDLQGFAESLTSAASAPVVNVTSSAVLGAGGSLDFGPKRVGASATKTVALTNTGTSPLVISNVVASGTGFSASLGTCTAPVAPGRNCRVSVTFAPTAAGSFTGLLTITSNAVNSPTTVVLTGTGR